MAGSEACATVNRRSDADMAGSETCPTVNQRSDADMAGSETCATDFDGDKCRKAL